MTKNKLIRIAIGNFNPTPLNVIIDVTLHIKLINPGWEVPAWNICNDFPEQHLLDLATLTIHPCTCIQVGLLWRNLRRKRMRIRYQRTRTGRIPKGRSPRPSSRHRKRDRRRRNNWTYLFLWVFRFGSFTGNPFSISYQWDWRTMILNLGGVPFVRGRIPFTFDRNTMAGGRRTTNLSYNYYPSTAGWFFWTQLSPCCWSSDDPILGRGLMQSE